MSTLELELETEKYMKSLKDLSDDVLLSIANKITSIIMIRRFDKTKGKSDSVEIVPDWIRNYKLSSKTLAMSPKDRVDFDSDYKKLFEEALIEKYK